ncbi:hypothetical protein SPRG_10175 [Saprolegnia parasitica CBS 223.65]|uniref:THH1/TOM1/TOM3 domain-containing protein n=1 Tax=Saprolegnia parasitica (strain CBS 223.65) TaxID=695850 RepID=A0A067CCW6_SAPPC|nr:hypothetical protein SPRG_10175 [Saprolegnia parasitica CBS 223.65]KDO24642.1 hypothetical protein SPRG_10175 [Saprolegnia parasitica CBS 223.65]|eukprot:XP_012204710.1 hypothetical protein SPRG_10175 [Saprolegnia parasitica CBS 223.65]
MAMLFLSGLAMASYFLALCYMLMTFISVSKLYATRHKNASMSRTTQLLLMTISLGCLFRTATFTTLCFLDFQHTDASLSPLSARFQVPDDTPHAEESDLSFYNKVVAVLFNLPDYLFVSAYLLVVLLWAETFQSSRRHWFSADQFHRKWMVFYLIFNGGLYLTQVVLYGLLFLKEDGAIAGIFDNDAGTRLALIPSLIFYTVAAADLALPAIILGTWMYLSVTLSGFPYKSVHAKAKLSKVGRVALVWSLGRILYSVMILLTFTKGWFNTEKDTVSMQSMLLVALFVLAEITPIYSLLDSDLLMMLSTDDYLPLGDK